MTPRRASRPSLGLHWIGCGQGAKGFTLVELMLVIGIAAILTAISIPAISSILTGNNLTQAGQQVSDQVGLAQQLAVTHNSTMELRLFKLPGAPTSGYTHLQIWTSTPSVSGTTTMQGVSRTSILPSGTVISENTILSSALLGNTPVTMPADAGALANATYVAFQIRPTGVVTPSLSMNAYNLTILSSHYAANGTLPRNYVVVQINPMTATPVVYRP